MTLGPHLGNEILPFLIDVILAVVQQVYGLHREREDLSAALIVQPIHESFLKPVDGIPFHRRAVRKNKVLKHAFEVRMIEIGHIPENGLISACCGGLIQRVDDLFKGICYDLVDGALSGGGIYYIACLGIVIVTILLADEVIQIALPLRATDGTAELACQCKDEIHKGAVEGRQVLRGSAGTADTHVPMQEERVQGNRYAVGLAHKTSLIMAVDLMLFQLPEIFLSQIDAIHLAQLLIHGKAVEGNSVLLEDFGLQRCDTCFLHICVGIDGTSGGWVVCSGIAFDEILIPLVGLILGDSHRVRSFFL